MFGVIVNDNKYNEPKIPLFDTKEDLFTFVDVITTDVNLATRWTITDYFVTYSKDEIEKYF